MLTQIRPVLAAGCQSEFVPNLLAPLIEVANSRNPLEPSVLAITKSLGFDSFMYGMSTSADPVQESRSYVFTTLPREWVVRYDQRAYIEVDPRVRHGIVSSTPLIWDSPTTRGRDAMTDAFLDDAAAHGVASGVAFALHGVGTGLALIALNSANRFIDEARREAIVGMLGDILLFGMYFHEIFMKNVVEQGLAPRLQGAPLSDREKQCLMLAAHGQTSHDIAEKLALAERTIQFHFDAIRSKLEATNRQEAIAKAIALGVIHP
jgi:DNA-binding CsgD family transcriptional regulator